MIGSRGPKEAVDYTGTVPRGKAGEANREAARREGSKKIYHGGMEARRRRERRKALRAKTRAEENSTSFAPLLRRNPLLPLFLLLRASVSPW